MDKEEEKLSKSLRSEQFKESFRKRVEEETWGKDLPLVYLDENGWVVKHWKDGTIEKLQKA
jgi:ABC-type oligopeptide transport system substrate-binding subunit